MENILQLNLTVHQQIQIAENKTSLVPVLIRKKKNIYKISPSYSFWMFLLMEMPLFVSTDLTTISGSFRSGWLYLERCRIIFFLLQVTFFLSFLPFSDKYDDLYMSQRTFS